MTEELRDLVQEIVEVQATGCTGVGAYRRWAKENGFEHVETWNTTSSAGDWQFLVSKDGIEWQVLTQENNWPRSGFSYYLGEQVFIGSFEDVSEELSELEQLLW